MKVNRNKIEGALSELRASRSEIRHLLKDAFGGEKVSVKESVLDKVSSMFEGLENYLNILMNADLVREDV